MNAADDPDYAEALARKQADERDRKEAAEILATLKGDPDTI